MTAPEAPPAVHPDVQRILDALHAASKQPRPCLLHADVHPHTDECAAAWADWMKRHAHVPGLWSRDAYEEDVEQAILARLIREHAPRRPKPPTY